MAVESQSRLFCFNEITELLRMFVYQNNCLNYYFKGIEVGISYLYNKAIFFFLQEIK